MTTRRARWLMSGALAAALAAGWVAWERAGQVPGGPGPWEPGRLIRIGYAVEAPYAYLDEHGALTGLEIEGARRVVSRLGPGPVEWVQVEFGALLRELEAGRFDAVVAGMFITAERAQRVAFSEPTFRATQALLVRRGNPLQLRGYHDLRGRPGLRVAVLDGSVEAALVRRIGPDGPSVVSVPDALTGRVAVETGLADALALSSPAVGFMARQDALGATEALSAPARLGLSAASLAGYGAVAFRRGDQRLLTAWNGALADYVGGEAHRRSLETFGLDEASLPAGASTADVLSGRAP